MKHGFAMLAILAVVLLPVAASAEYKAVPGVRALELKGTEARSNEWVELSDYHGKWVLAEFWATW